MLFAPNIERICSCNMSVGRSRATHFTSEPCLYLLVHLHVILTVDNSSTVGIPVSGMVDGSLTQFISFFNRQVILVATVHHTIGIGWTRPNRKHIIWQACAITVHIVQPWTLNDPNISVKRVVQFYPWLKICVTLSISLYITRLKFNRKEQY